MRLNPEIIITPDNPIVQLRECRDSIEDEMLEVAKIANNQGWGIGVKFSVQYISHDRDRLFAEATFIVTRNVENLITTNPESRTPNTKSVNTLGVEIITPWYKTREVDERAEEKRKPGRPPKAKEAA